MSRRKDLSDEDKALWAEVTRTVRPLDERPVAETPPKPAPARRRPLQPRDPLEAPDAPAPANLDRRTARKIARGHLSIDRRLDLHGCTQVAARQALGTALRQMYTGGGRCLLVVTGRGGRRFAQTDSLPAAHRRRSDFGPEGGGVLRREVPRWLRSTDLGGFVSAFGPAADAHGGAGALYVLVRRRRG